MFKKIKAMFVPNPELLATQMLCDARLEMLKAQAAKEYWTAQCDMFTNRIARLQRVINNS